jgi:hypothetical protein
MHIQRNAIALVSALAITASLTTGCASGPSPAATDNVPTGTTEPIAFSIEVAPAAAVGLNVPGAKVVFLVRATGDPADGAIAVRATSNGGSIAVEPESLIPGAVGEVTLVPAPVAGSEVPVEIEINAERDGLVRTETRTITVQPGTDELRAEADGHLAAFMPWLAATRADLGINPDTEWEGVPGAWVLVVSHYLYFSSDWELDLAWHVMVPPDDWCRINLRRRWVEMTPSVAFEISSVAGGTAPREIEPEPAVWR